MSEQMARLSIHGGFVKMENFLFRWFQLQQELGRLDFRTADAMTGVAFLAGRTLTTKERATVSRTLAKADAAGVIGRCADGKQMFIFQWAHADLKDREPPTQDRQVSVI